MVCFGTEQQLISKGVSTEQCAENNSGMRCVLMCLIWLHALSSGLCATCQWLDWICNVSGRPFDVTYKVNKARFLFGKTHAELLSDVGATWEHAALMR